MSTIVRKISHHDDILFGNATVPKCNQSSENDILTKQPSVHSFDVLNQTIQNHKITNSSVQESYRSKSNENLMRTHKTNTLLNTFKPIETQLINHHQNTSPEIKLKSFDEHRQQYVHHRPTYDHDVVEEEDDSFCCICQDYNASSADPFVYCDRCNICVHVQCYGIPLSIRIPTSEFICSRCQYLDYWNTKLIQMQQIEDAKSNSVNEFTDTKINELKLLASANKSIVSDQRDHLHNDGAVEQILQFTLNDLVCCLCLKSKGCLKQTTTGQFVHLVCAQWIPEVFFRQSTGNHLPDITHIPIHKYHQSCAYCELTNKGCCTECSDPTCSLWYHVTCGISAGVKFMFYKPKKGQLETIVCSFCHIHSARKKKSKKLS